MSGFRVESVDFVDVKVRRHDSHSIVRFSIVTLSYFLHWLDFDPRQRPLPVLVESGNPEALRLKMP
jgi:hypothetical protein